MRGGKCGHLVLHLLRQGRRLLLAASLGFASPRGLGFRLCLGTSCRFWFRLLRLHLQLLCDPDPESQRGSTSLLLCLFLEGTKGWQLERYHSLHTLPRKTGLFYYFPLFLPPPLTPCSACVSGLLPLKFRSMKLQRFGALRGLELCVYSCPTAKYSVTFRVDSPSVFSLEGRCFVNSINLRILSTIIITKDGKMEKKSNEA